MKKLKSKSKSTPKKALKKADDAKFWKDQRLLIIAPHPDDEVYGCGGTMAKAKALGAEVYVLYLSVGDLTFYEKRGVVKAEERITEVQKVSDLLKLDGYDVVFKDVHTHLRLDSIPRRDLIAYIERESSVALDRVQPTIMAIPARSYN